MDSKQHYKDIGFGWWTTWAWLGLIIGTIMIIGDRDLSTSAKILIFIVNTFLMISILTYNKYAFLIATVISFNPLLWIINGIYLKNRWNHPRVNHGKKTTFKDNSNSQYNNNIKCKNCNKTNPINSKFCIFCGSQIFKDKENVKSISLQECIVTLFAYVAKADGVVSSNEAKIISELLDHISDNSQTHRDVLKEIYNIAKNRSNRDYVYYARTLHHISQKEISISNREDFLKIFIRWLVYLVYADNVKNIKQSIVVDEIARVINISEAYLNSLHKEFDDKNNNKSKTYHSRQLTIEESYDVLKCSPNSTNNEIKKAYRELVKQYHPDTLQSKELSEDFIIFANEKLQEINNAYEIIKKHRGI